MRLLRLLLPLLMTGCLPAMALAVSSQNRPVRVVLGLGNEYRQENNVQNYLEDKSFLNYMVGAQWEAWRFFYERADITNDTSSGTLSVEKKWMNELLWVQLEGEINRWLWPFLGLGTGRSRTVIESRLSGTATSDESGFQWVNGLCAGVLIPFSSPYFDVFVSGEARMMAADGWDPSPFISGVLRIGVRF